MKSIKGSRTGRFVLNINIVRIIVTAGVALTLSTAQAAIDTWFAPVTGQWTNGAPLPAPNPPFLLGVNTWWADTTVPGAADTANFPHVGAYGVAFPATPPAIDQLNLTAGSVTFASSGGEKTLTSGGTSITTGTLTLGTSGNSIVLDNSNSLLSIQDGGTFNVFFGSRVTDAPSVSIGSSAASSGNVFVQGTSSSITHGSAIGSSLTVGNTNLASAPSSLNVGTITSGAVYNSAFHGVLSGQITINPTGSINIGSALTTGTFNANQNVVINGGALRRLGGTFDLDDGRTMTVQNGGSAEFTGTYTTTTNAVYNVDGVGSTLSATSTVSIANGAAVNVSGGGSVAGNFISIPAGTLAVSGAGSSANASNAGFVIWGNSGATATVTFSNNATGSIPGPLELAEGNNSNADLDITSGADLTVGSISLASGNSTGANAQVTVTGVGSTMTSSSLTIGNASQGFAQLEVLNGAVLTVGVGGSTRLNARGTLTINNGTVDLKTLETHEGTLYFDSGSLSYLGNLTVGAGGLLGANLTLSSNRSLTLSGTSEVDVFQTLTLSGGTLNTGSMVIDGTATLTSGTLTLASGGSVTIQPTGRLQTSLSINAPIFGSGAGSAIAVAATGLSLGSAASFNGFNHEGTLDVGGHTVTLNSAGYAKLGSVTTIAGGVINAPNGVALGSGSNLVGSGAVNARVAGELGAVIQASGALALGAASSPAGFVYSGELRTLQHTVTLNSSAQASLGNLTTLGNGASPGALSATNGVVIDFGESLTGYGTVNSANLLAKRSVINGTVLGASPAQPITLTGWVKGVGSFDNVVFTGTTDLGLSPTLTTVGSITFGTTNTLIMELGGTSRGSQYDAILANGNLTLDGSLAVTLINGFSPNAGDSFDILDWGGLSGTFNGLTLPTLGEGLMWNASQLYTLGALSVALAGDYDLDGTVDAADYVVWRKTGINGPTGYDTWRTNFGEPGGIGSGASANTNVPEPATLMVLIVAAFGIRLRRRSIA